SNTTINTTITSSTSSAVPNPVAIDNKIEQAMDLVKTHLTFAVREEVEILRTTISDLEGRLTELDPDPAFRIRNGGNPAFRTPKMSRI
uniref:Rab_eff_C domain-containing protein n=1 Tax=Globodera pallida TaxID=36090 RepID=A0A183CJR7_GLOPA